MQWNKKISSRKKTFKELVDGDLVYCFIRRSNEILIGNASIYNNSTYINSNIIGVIWNFFESDNPDWDKTCVNSIDEVFATNECDIVNHPIYKECISELE